MSKTILYVTCSPMGDKSYTRKLANTVIEKLKTQYSGSVVVTRDLDSSPLPHLNGTTLGAFFTPPEKRDAALINAIKLSDEAVKELLAAEVIVIAAPMWNFGIPSVLKAWIDHIVRAGVTFQYTANGPIGLVPAGRKIIIVSARGGIYSEGPGKGMDHQESYLQAVFSFLGYKDFSFIRAEGVALGDESVKRALATAETQLSEAVQKVA